MQTFQDFYESNLFSGLCRKLAFCDSDLPDIRQEAALALHQALQAWEPSHGVPLKAFVCICVKRRVFTYRFRNLGAIARTRRAVKNQEAVQVEMEDELPDEPAGFGVDSADLRRVLERASKLEGNQRKVAELILKEGAKNHEVADALGVSNQRVGQLVARVVAQLAPGKGSVEP